MMMEERPKQRHGHFWTNSVNSSDFTLLTPEENQDVNLRPTFSWTESNDIDLYDEVGYTIQIGTGSFQS